MPEIKVDPDVLDALARELFRLRDQFANLEKDAEEYDEFVGHKGLAEELRSTANNWSKKRDKLIENLGVLATTALEVAEHYRCLDTTMATQIRAASGPGAP
jgi:hypothetical protein